MSSSQWITERERDSEVNTLLVTLRIVFESMNNDFTLSNPADSIGPKNPRMVDILLVPAKYQMRSCH